MGLTVIIIFLCLWSGIGCVVLFSEANDGFQFIKYPDTTLVKCTKLIAFLVACGPCVWGLFSIMAGHALYADVIVPLFKRIIKKPDNRCVIEEES